MRGRQCEQREDAAERAALNEEASVGDVACEQRAYSRSGDGAVKAAAVVRGQTG